VRFQDAIARTRQDASGDATHYALIVHEENRGLQKTLASVAMGAGLLAKANVDGTSPNLRSVTWGGRGQHGLPREWVWLVTAWGQVAA